MLDTYDPEFDNPDEATDASEEADAERAAEENENAERTLVRAQLEQVKDFLGGITLDDLKSGNWFARLLTASLATYTKQVDAEYFRRKYPNLPPDAIAAARVTLASRYAGIEGGLSAAAYTGAVSATLGSGGGASPLTLPAAGTSFAVDLVYTSQFQLRLAYDLAIIYGVPFDLSDSEVLWKFIRIAFSVRTSEVAETATAKWVPAVVRPLIKKIYSKGVLDAGRSLPVIGKYLAQRNVLKFGLPVVGIPLSVAVNYWSTKVVGRQAGEAFRKETRIIERAKRLWARTEAHKEMLWTVWMVAKADRATSEEEWLLLHHLADHAGQTSGLDDVLSEIRVVIDVDHAKVWGMLEALGEDDLRAIYDAAETAAVVNGKIDRAEVEILERLAEMAGVEFLAAPARKVAKTWA